MLHRISDHYDAAIVSSDKVAGRCRARLCRSACQVSRERQGVGKSVRLARLEVRDSGKLPSVQTDTREGVVPYFARAREVVDIVDREDVSAIEARRAVVTAPVIQ